MGSPRRVMERSECLKVHYIILSGRDLWVRLTQKHRIEVAVKQILSGMDVRTNASVANPEALEWFKVWAKDNS